MRFGWERSDDYFFVGDDPEELKIKRKELAVWFRKNSKEPPVLPLLEKLDRQERLEAASWIWEEHLSQQSQPDSPNPNSPRSSLSWSSEGHMSSETR